MSAIYYLRVISGCEPKTQPSIFPNQFSGSVGSEGSHRRFRYGSASGSVSQRYGSEDPHPDPYQNVTDPEHGSKFLHPSSCCCYCSVTARRLWWCVNWWSITTAACISQPTISESSHPTVLRPGLSGNNNLHFAATDPGSQNTCVPDPDSVRSVDPFRIRNPGKNDPQK